MAVPVLNPGSAVNWVPRCSPTTAGISIAGGGFKVVIGR